VRQRLIRPSVPGRGRDDGWQPTLRTGSRGARSGKSGRVYSWLVPSFSGIAESVENAVSHGQVLLGSALRQPGGTRQDARLLDYLTVDELFAG
jgi:hypothetical protein